MAKPKAEAKYITWPPLYTPVPALPPATSPSNPPTAKPSANSVPAAHGNGHTDVPSSSLPKWQLSLATDLNSPLTTGGWTNFSGYMGAAVQNYRNWTKVVNGVSSNTTTYATTDQANDAIAFIRSQGTNRWLPWLAFNAPHGPITKPPVNLLTTAAYLNLSGTPADLSTNARAYQEAMTQAMDTEIGRLLTVVPTNTDIIFLGGQRLGNSVPAAALLLFPDQRRRARHERACEVHVVRRRQPHAAVYHRSGRGERRPDG